MQVRNPIRHICAVYDRDILRGVPVKGQAEAPTTDCPGQIHTALYAVPLGMLAAPCPTRSCPSGTLLISVTHPAALRATTTFWCPYQSDYIKMKPQADHWISRPTNKGAARSTEAQAREKLWLNVVKSDMELCNCSPLWSVLRETPVQCKPDQVAGGC